MAKGVAPGGAAPFAFFVEGIDGVLARPAVSKNGNKKRHFASPIVPKKSEKLGTIAKRKSPIHYESATYTFEGGGGNG